MPRKHFSSKECVVISVGASSSGETRPVWSSRVSTASTQPLCSAISESLYETGYLHLSQIRIATRGNQVYLFGKVPSYYLKQVAQTATLTVPGVESVQNDLVVEYRWFPNPCEKISKNINKNTPRQSRSRRSFRDSYFERFCIESRCCCREKNDFGINKTSRNKDSRVEPIGFSRDKFPME